MSRAFVKESDAEAAGLREDGEHDKKRAEWIKLQQKKLDFLLNDPKAQSLDPEKRERWIKEARDAIDGAS